MTNEKGFSWPESILSLSILMIIFGTLLPLYSHMSAQMEMKKLDMHAAETAYHAAVLHSSYGLTEGENLLEQTVYRWSIHANSICVTYRNFEKEVMKCIDV